VRDVGDALHPVDLHVFRFCAPNADLLDVELVMSTMTDAAVRTRHAPAWLGAIFALPVAFGSSLVGHPTVTTAALAAGVSAAWWAAAFDIRTLRLPNPAVAAVAGFAATASIPVHRLSSTLLAGVVGALPFLAIHLARPAGFGFGDVKYAAACGMLVGTLSVGATSIFLALAFLSAAAVRFRHERGAIPLGPTIFAGAVVALLAGAALRVTGANV
jgi:leader peptidase (prepilin peptidase)/N-methyltransferase